MDDRPETTAEVVVLDETLLVPYNSACTIENLAVDALAEYHKIFGFAKPYELKLVKDVKGRILSSQLLVGNINTEKRFEVFLNDKSDMASGAKVFQKADVTNILSSHRVFQLFTVNQIIGCIKLGFEDIPLLLTSTDYLRDILIILDELKLIAGSELLQKTCLTAVETILRLDKPALNDWCVHALLETFRNSMYADIILSSLSLLCTPRAHNLTFKSFLPAGALLGAVECNLSRFPGLSGRILAIYEGAAVADTQENGSEASKRISSLPVSVSNKLAQRPAALATLSSAGAAPRGTPPAPLPAPATAVHGVTAELVNNRALGVQDSVVTHSELAPTGGAAKPLDRIQQLLVSPELNCRRFGLKKLNRVISNGSLVSVQSIPVSAAGQAFLEEDTAGSFGIGPGAGERVGCLETEREAEDMGAALLQCLKLSLVPPAPKRQAQAQPQDASGAGRMALTTKLVMDILGNTPSTDLSGVMQALGCLDLLLAEFPAATARALTKSFRLLLTLCHVHLTCPDNVFIANLSSHFIRVVLTSPHGAAAGAKSDTCYPGCTGWQRLLAAGENANIAIEESAIVQFLAVYTLAGTSFPPAQPAPPKAVAPAPGEFSVQAEAAQECHYMTDLPFLALSYLYSQHLLIPSLRDPAAKADTRLLDSILVNNNFAAFRHLWYWVMFAYSAQGTVESGDSSGLDTEANGKLCCIFALECVSGSSSRLIKNYLIKFSAVDK